jgi:hypothetical protein
MEPVADNDAEAERAPLPVSSPVAVPVPDRLALPLS